jgi:uncharacterized protein (TIGR00369 family)
VSAADGVQAALSAEKEAEVRQSFAQQGLMRAIGAEMTDLGPGRCTIELAYSERIAQQHGFFHGGIVGTIADTAGGYAALTLMPAGDDVLSAGYTINFLRPAAGERLIATGSVLRAGRTLSVVRVDVRVDSPTGQTLCAALQQTVSRVARGHS